LTPRQLVALIDPPDAPLDDIRAVLAGETDELATLRRHHDRLLAEADRLRTLATTVARTIAEREDGPQMPAEELFAGFRDDPHAAEARERHGDTAVEAQARAGSWDDGTARAVHEEGGADNRDAADLMRAGVPVDDPRVQDVIGRHHAWVSHFWTPGRDAYIGLGRLYVDDARFTASIDATAPGPAAYLCDAMAVYANVRLS
jgi:hypothetical protein